MCEGEWRTESTILNPGHWKNTKKKLKGLPKRFVDDKDGMHNNKSMTGKEHNEKLGEQYNQTKVSPDSSSSRTRPNERATASHSRRRGMHDRAERVWHGLVGAQDAKPDVKDSWGQLLRVVCRYKIDIAFVEIGALKQLTPRATAGSSLRATTSSRHRVCSAR